MIAAEFVLFAVALRLIAGASYIWSTVKGRVQPSPITWLFWGLTALIAFVAQLQEGVGASAFMTLALALGPLAVFTIALLRRTTQPWRLTTTDIWCAACATIGIVLWQITDNPMLGITFSIVADIFGGIPTIIKAYLRPDTERAFPYLLSMASMVITLLTLQKWDFASFAFPLYIFAINGVIFTLVAVRAQVYSTPKPAGEPTPSQ